eukprot:XP_019924774.1 PREDICTED: uncharacterized protein LOC105333010 isoform X5 [Crassostrea gigas]
MGELDGSVTNQYGWRWTCVLFLTLVRKNWIPHLVCKPDARYIATGRMTLMLNMPVDIVWIKKVLVLRHLSQQRQRTLTNTTLD